MKSGSYKAIGLLGGGAALVAAIGWGAHPGGFVTDVRADPAYVSPAPPPPPPPPPPPMTYDPNQDYWTGQGDTGAAPGGGGG